MKFAFVFVAAVALGGAAFAKPSLETLKADYAANCAEEIGGKSAAKVCACTIAGIDTSLGGNQLELAYTVLVAMGDHADDGSTASGIGLTVDAYRKLRDQLQALEARTRASCSK